VQLPLTFSIEVEARRGLYPTPVEEKNEDGTDGGESG
jgi:hypothetical protein